MIISIRFINGKWHWEIYAPDDHSTIGKYAQGNHHTWKGMMQVMEVHISELEKQNEGKTRA